MMNQRIVCLANIHPQLTMRTHFGALGTNFNPSTWCILTDGSHRIPGTKQFAMYQIGSPG